MKLSNLLSRDFKIVEKKKVLFLIPAAIVLVAIIAMIIFGTVTGNALNLGMDFSGGYSINVKLSTKLTKDTYNSYASDIKKIVENVKDENGKPYGLKILKMQRQGDGESASIYIKYKAVADEIKMEEEVNPAIQTALNDSIFKLKPIIKVDGNVLTANYGSFNVPLNSLSALRTRAIEAAKEKNITLNENDIQYGDKKSIIKITSTAMNAELEELLVEQISINDKYSGQAQLGDITGATVSSELLINAILAIALALTLMLIYIAFRFEVSSGLAAVIALAHDVLMMFSFMAIFHIEFNSTFIAALITILGYSINNTIIIFDRIRERMKSLFDRNSSATFIANTSVKETIWRSINTTITTLIMIGMVAIIGVTDIRIFAFPILIGLFSGLYSSVAIAPTVWAMWKDRKKRTLKTKTKSQNAEKAATV